MTYHLTTLPSGLRVASESMPGVESVAFTVSVGAGARYEEASEHGLSHLLEHMAFKGTTTRSARDIAELFDGIGGQLNAYTSMENTVYYAKVLSGDLPLAVEIMADILERSTFPEDELKREQEVIIQEIAMHRDSPEDLLVDAFDAEAFKDQPLGRSILSTPEKIAGYTRADVEAYMHKHYTPERIIISAAGKLEHEALVALVSRQFTQQQARSAPPPPRAAYVGGGNITTGDFEQLHIALGLPAVSIHDPRFYALQLYANILGGSMSSRLFQEVREKQGLAYHVYASVSAYEDCGVLSVGAATAGEKGHALVAALCSELKRMAEGVSAAELTRAKQQYKAELLMAREGTQTVASWIGRHLLLYGEYRRVDALIARAEAVQVEDITSLARTLLEGTPTFAALGVTDHVPSYNEVVNLLKG